MYSRPTIYKIYSIVSAVFGIYAFIHSIVTALTFSLEFISNIPNVKVFETLIKVSLIIFSVISLFFAYMDFSSFYCFGKVLTYDFQNESNGFKKTGFMLSSNVYKIYGTILYWLIVIIFVLSFIISLIVGVAARFYYLIPITLVCCGIGIPIFYFTIYTRYRIIAETMSYVEQNKQIDFKTDVNDSMIYKRYSLLFYVLCVLTAVAGVVTLTVVLSAFTPILQYFIGQMVSIIIGLVIVTGMYVLSTLTFGSFYKLLSEKAK